MCSAHKKGMPDTCNVPRRPFDFMSYILFQVNGGSGKCIAATAVCAAIKKQYPDRSLIVVSGYPELFINNPNVRKSFAFGGLSYFYQDYISDRDTIPMMQDPYLEADAIYSKKHLIEVWCDLCRVKYNGEIPQIFMTQREIDGFQRQINVDKPIMLIQPNGGADPNKKYSWARDLPFDVVNKVVEHFRYRYAIVHFKREDQISYNNTFQVTAPMRQLLAISLLSQKRLLIDSFMQHASAALNLPSVVCWIVNKPSLYGYSLNTHICANKFTAIPELRSSYINQFDISGNEVEFPYNNESEIFDVDKIIKALEDNGNESSQIFSVNKNHFNSKIELPK